MLNLKTTTALVATGMMALSGAAMAEGMKQSIKELPESGNVMLQGTVDSIEMDNDFTLRDGAGDTIEIDVSDDKDYGLNEGDRVQVSGSISSGTLGVGEEIDATNVTILGRTEAKTKPRADVTSPSARTTGEGMALSKVDADADNKEWHGGEYGAIDKLPDEGAVTISGTVTDSDPDENRFVLEDNTGETIDVHTTQKFTLSQGDKVRVNGTMTDEALGIGEQIVSAKVERIGTR